MNMEPQTTQQNMNARWATAGKQRRVKMYFGVPAGDRIAVWLAMRILATGRQEGQGRMVGKCAVQ
jgi:hypothetical protein